MFIYQNAKGGHVQRKVGNSYCIGQESPMRCPRAPGHLQGPCRSPAGLF